MKKLLLFIMLPLFLFSQQVDERVTTIGYINDFGVFEEEAKKHLELILEHQVETELFPNRPLDYETEVNFKLLYNTNHDDLLVILDYLEYKNQKVGEDPNFWKDLDMIMFFVAKHTQKYSKKKLWRFQKKSWQI